MTKELCCYSDYHIMSWNEMQIGTIYYHINAHYLLSKQASSLILILQTIVHQKEVNYFKAQVIIRILSNVRIMWR